MSPSSPLQLVDPAPSFLRALCMATPFLLPLSWPKPISAWASHSLPAFVVLLFVLISWYPLLLRIILIYSTTQWTTNLSLALFVLGACIYCYMLSQYVVVPLRQAVPRVSDYLLYRQDAHKDAVDCIVQDAAKNLFQRHALYDVYLPTTTTPSQTNPRPTTTTTRMAFFFVPGALVDRTAYAVPLSQLASQHGILVVVLNSGPLRLPLRHLGASAHRVQSILQKVEQDVGGSSSYTWHFGGHSMGGYSASDIYMELARTDSPFLKRTFSKLVLWGSALVTPEFQASPYPVLQVDASNDLILGVTKEASPIAKATRYMVEGGNHSGFGSYGPQSYPKQDGTRTVALEEQHRQTVQATAGFLLKKME